MAWLRLEDTFGSHPKIVGLSDKAFRLHVNGLFYCAQHETDGLIRKEALELITAGFWDPDREEEANGKRTESEREANGANASLTPSLSKEAVRHRRRRLIAAVVRAGLWEVCEKGWMVHDWLDYNYSKEDLAVRRAQAVRRNRKWRANASQKDEGERKANGANAAPSPPPSSYEEGRGVPTPARAERAPALPEDQPPTPLTPHKLEELASASSVMAKVLKLRPSQNGDEP